MAEKQKFHIEYLLKASPEMLYQYVSTPSGLAEWFADSVQSKGNLFTFTWAGSEGKSHSYSPAQGFLACASGGKPTKTTSIFSR